MQRNAGAGRPPRQWETRPPSSFPSRDPDAPWNCTWNNRSNHSSPTPGPATSALTDGKSGNQAACRIQRCPEFRQAHPTRHQLGAEPDSGALIGQAWGGAGTLLGALLRSRSGSFNIGAGFNADWSIPRPGTRVRNGAGPQRTGFDWSGQGLGLFLVWLRQF